MFGGWVDHFGGQKVILEADWSDQIIGDETDAATHFGSAYPL